MLINADYLFVKVRHADLGDNQFQKKKKNWLKNSITQEYCICVNDATARRKLGPIEPIKTSNACVSEVPKYDG